MRAAGINKCDLIRCVTPLPYEFLPLFPNGKCTTFHLQLRETTATETCESAKEEKMGCAYVDQKERNAKKKHEEKKGERNRSAPIRSLCRSSVCRSSSNSYTSMEREKAAENMGSYIRNIGNAAQA